mmetsp:Transcript_15931/g.32023  ORF Transcript_15931/g.32023 Transcript_15931/m.32023 type:complete len:100 (+) Transcript_15931:1303-1602(+)
MKCRRTHPNEVGFVLTLRFDSDRGRNILWTREAHRLQPPAQVPCMATISLERPQLSFLTHCGNERAASHDLDLHKNWRNGNNFAGTGCRAWNVLDTAFQ